MLPVRRNDRFAQIDAHISNSGILPACKVPLKAQFPWLSWLSKPPPHDTKKVTRSFGSVKQGMRQLYQARLERSWHRNEWGPTRRHLSPHPDAFKRTLMLSKMAPSAMRKLSSRGDMWVI